MKLKITRWLLLSYIIIGVSAPIFSQEDINVFRETGSFSDENTDQKIVDLRLNFNEEWKFSLKGTSTFFNTDFDDSQWRSLNLPHDWSIEGKFDKDNPCGASGGFLPTGVGYYRKHFTLPNQIKGKRVKIRFDGVYMNSSVYINGIYLGSHPYGFTTLEYDLTPYLKYQGEDNIISVKVDNSLQPSSRWYTGSGINRNVHLYITEQQHFQSFETFFRTTELQGQHAHMKVDCKIVSNRYKESQLIKFQRYPTDTKRVVKDAEVVASLLDREGNTVAQAAKTYKLSDYSSLDVELDLDLPKANLWSHKNPYLYTLELSLLIEGKLIDSEQSRVGVREITFDSNRGMIVNGEKVIAKGVCLHKDAGSFGTAVPKDVWRYRLQKLKDLGCNAIRVHCPADPDFIDLCDEMGFYFLAEALDEWDKSWEFGYTEDNLGKLNYTYNKYFEQWAQTDVKAMVKRDRNHPSVFIYSVGNEVPNQRYENGAATLKKLMGWVKEEDPTRLVTVGCDWSAWGNTNGFMETMDIAGYNYPDRYYKMHYKEEHERYPNRLLLGTENYENLENWIMVRDQEWAIGLFLWVGIDYIGEALRWPRRNWEWGLIDIGSNEKPIYHYWRAFWSEKPMVHIAVELPEKEKFDWRCYNIASHWNFEKSDVDTVYVFSNTKQVELFQNGRSLGKKRVDPDTYQAIYRVKYKKGDLRAVAYNNAKPIAEHSLATAAQAANISLAAEKSTVSVKNGDLIFVTLEVQDTKGVRVPYANNEIEVEVEGAGELIGLDSGDPNSHELYKQNRRRAFEGRLLLTVRPTSSGEVTITCKSDQLHSESITVIAKE